VPLWQARLKECISVLDDGGSLTAIRRDRRRRAASSSSSSAAAHSGVADAADAEAACDALLLLLQAQALGLLSERHRPAAEMTIGRMMQRDGRWPTAAECEAIEAEWAAAVAEAVRPASVVAAAEAVSRRRRCPATAAADAAIQALLVGSGTSLDVVRAALEQHGEAASEERLSQLRALRNKLKKKKQRKQAKASAEGDLTDDQGAKTAVGKPLEASRSSGEKPLAAEPPEEPSELTCPITNEIMIDPVFTEDGQTYERAAIERWLSTHSTSPLTGKQLAHRNLTPNVMARGLCRRWREEHPVE
jgi:hypothetical protein